MNRLHEEFWALTGVAAPTVAFPDGAGVLPSALATGELATGAVACAAGAAAVLAEARGCGRPEVTVDGRRTAAAFRSDQLFRLDGEAPEGFGPLSGFWRAADGWVRTHANYPNHRAALLGALALPPDAGPGELASALGVRPAVELEEQVERAGGVCVAVRTEAGWRRHPQAGAVAALPLVGWSQTGGAAPRRLGAAPTGPLLPAAGLQVLDLTRVIAGPVATRTLALLGADVLRVDAPRLPEIPWQHLDTGMGKRSALLDLDRPADRRLLDHLVDEADVVVTGYRPGALDQFGLDPGQLATRRPGLVVAGLSAWGPGGPWSDRRGFDSIVQAATGIAMAESADGETPGRLPAQALDHATGYLLAAGILVAVARQVDVGGTVHVQAHLARTAHWLLAHPAPGSGARGSAPPAGEVMRERNGPAGQLRYPAPAVQLEGGPSTWTEVGRPWGSDRPAWQSPAPPRPEVSRGGGPPSAGESTRTAGA